MSRFLVALTLTLVLVGTARADTYSIGQGNAQVCALCVDNGDGLCSTSTSAFSVSVDATASNMCKETGGNLATLVTKLNGGLPAALGAGGGIKIDGSGTALPVTISATGATVFPELDASKVLVPVSATIANSQASASISTGCTGSCRRVTFCNTGTTNPICVKFASGWTVAYPIPARAAASSALQCISFQNVTTAYWNSTISADGVTCTGGSTTLVIPEDD